MTPLDYARKCADTVIDTFPNAELPPLGKFHYHAGVFLSGVERTYLLSKQEKYNNYIKAWLDTQIDENGDVYNADVSTLDDIEPCNLVLRYYKSGEQRYKKTLDAMVPYFLSWPCNNAGGFWHKECYPNQMWLDGLYMAGPLAVQYGLMENKREYIELIHRQLLLMWNNIRDEKTGLLLHAWDESKKESWADSITGCSPEIWGRAVGWYLVASADISEMLSDDDPLKKDFTDCAVQLAEAVAKFQDKNTGLWYQVVNKGDSEDNWLETSCSCLFVYGISSLLRRGLLDEKYRETADKGYNGVINNKLEVTQDRLVVKDICIGTGVGDYQHYINRPRTDNDLHGTGAFILMCTEYYKLLRKE